MAAEVATSAARRLGLSGLAFLFAFAACDPGTITLETVGSGTSPGIVRQVLTVHTVVDGADRALADSLGWTQGVPNAEVRLLLNGTAEWRTFGTDQFGTVAIPDLGSGLYRLFAARILTDGEAASKGGALRAFGDGRTFNLSGDTVVGLHLTADRPGGLVIGEIGDGAALPWETGGNGYSRNLYFEVFNNSSDLLFLDGLIFGAATVPYRFTIPTPCSWTEVTRNDSTGVHARALLRFPGSGTEYPVPPGETRLVAMSAIDHRPVHPTLPDLSNADFEVGGSGAADNPDVPNVLDIGLEPFRSQNLFAISNMYFLAWALDVPALERKFRDGNGLEYYHLPTRELIDVIATQALWPDRDAEYPRCVPMIHSVFDRYEGGFKNIGFDANSPDEALRSLQRLVLRLDVNGRKVLLNTNTTGVDFAYGPRTPGWIPE